MALSSDLLYFNSITIGIPVGFGKFGSNNIYPLSDFAGEDGDDLMLTL